jgi:hypothetical protein
MRRVSYELSNNSIPFLQYFVNKVILQIYYKLQNRRNFSSPYPDYYWLEVFQLPRNLII